MLGKKIGGRYEIIERVGGGGMAIVYKAKDTLLDRIIALKILRPQYAIDEDFVHRFRREAKAAASLSHPHVVSIYDVGEEEDTHYIVMEYVEGSTLKEYINKHAPIDVKEAVDLTKQIAEALDHAHHNQIIHRDIKPHNILISKSKKIKVTDFGIARAVSSATITHTGSVIGSVHYFSPEQAKGGITGEKSDLYSLGVVLYEMLTGHLPFSGESPISVALKHLQEKFTDPRKINPSIPQSVENIILRAMAKDPYNRYKTAKDMLQDLDTCLKRDRMNEAPVVIEEDLEDEENTKIVPAVSEDMIETKIANPSPVHSSTHDDGDDDEYDEEDGHRSRKRFWIKTALIFSFVLLMGFGLYMGFVYAMDIFYVEEVQVEDVTGRSIEEATRILEAQGLEVDITQESYSQIFEEGQVINQFPVGGGIAKENNPVRLTVSLGKEKREMRSFYNMHYQAAERILNNLDFEDFEIVFEENDEVSEGYVFRQEPEAKEEIVTEETIVTLFVSSGPATIAMPNLIGLSEEAAEATLIKHNLELDRKEEGYSEYNEGIVYRQHPVEPAEDVEEGTPITIWISKGKQDEHRMDTQSVDVKLGNESDAQVMIFISDVDRDGERVVNEVLTNDQTYNFNVKVSPSRNATIEIYMNGSLYEEPIVVTYD